MSVQSLTLPEIQANFGNFPGYQGWSLEAAQADFGATRGVGKGGATTSATSSVPDINSILAALGVNQQQPDETSNLSSLLKNLDILPQQFFTAAEREQAEKDALEKLRPYYERILTESQGDVTLAKKRLEEDYQQGVRYREEDLATARQGYAILEPQEREQLLSEMNRRGILQSTISTQEQTELTEQQQRRREAIERALGRQTEAAGIIKGRSLEDIGLKQPRYERELEQEKRQRAFQIANIAEQKKGQRTVAELSRFLMPEEFTR